MAKIEGEISRIENKLSNEKLCGARTEAVIAKSVRIWTVTRKQKRS
ncbi:hypothetical protein ACNKHO_26780 [Shigella flexneri]